MGNIYTVGPNEALIVSGNLLVKNIYLYIISIHLTCCINTKQRYLAVFKRALVNSNYKLSMSYLIPQSTLNPVLFYMNSSIL